MTYEKYYERKKEDNFLEIYYIEGVRCIIKIDDMQKLLNIDDMDLYKKFLYYLDIHRIGFNTIKGLDEAIITFTSLLDEDEITIQKLIRIYLKYENLFCDKNGMRILKLVPKEFQNKIS